MLTDSGPASKVGPLPVRRNLTQASGDTPEAPQKGRADRFYFPSLDGLRFVAFLLVFTHHLPRATFSDPLFRLAERGWVGVDVFFALSAFLLYSLVSIELKKYGKIDFGRFLLRRALRIVPLLYVFTIAATVLYVLRSDVLDLARTAGIMGFVDNIICWFFGYSPIPYTDHLWTLSYEMQFYPFIPLLALAAAWRPRSLAWIIAGVIIFAIVSRIGLAIFKTPHPVIWVTPFLRPESMLGGILVAVAAASWFLASPRIRRASMAIFSLVLIAFFVLPMPLAGFGSAWTYFFVGAVATGAMVLALSNRFAIAVLSAQPIKFLGQISYGLYVFHVLAIGIATEMLAKPLELLPATRPMDYLVVASCALALTIALSVISWYALERQALRWKTLFENVPSRPI